MELLQHPYTPARLEYLRSQPGFYIVHGEADIGKKTMVEQLFSSAPVQLLQSETGTITVEQVRDVTADLHLTSTSGFVLIIDDAHVLSEYAQNALLKTLEELPRGGSVVMITPHPHTLLATVRSRASTVHIPSPLTDDTREWLQSGSMDFQQADHLQALIGNRPAVLSQYQATDQLQQRLSRLEPITDLFTASLPERLLAARHLSESLPDSLDEATRYARTQLRISHGEKLWQRAVMACEYAQQLYFANVNSKLILDAIALRSRA